MTAFVLVYHQAEDGSHELVFHYPYREHELIRPKHVKTKLRIAHSHIEACGEAYAVLGEGADDADDELAALYSSEGLRPIREGDVLCLRDFGSPEAFYRRDVLSWTRMHKSALRITEKP